MVALGLAAVAVSLLVYLLVRAVQLADVGSLTAILLAIGVVLLAVVGAVLVTGELRFGRDTQRLGRLLGEQGALPVDDLPRRSSGRVDRSAADAVFVERKAEVEAAPQDWRAWYRLALAYGDAGDTARGRRAARRAVHLWRETG